MSLKIITAYAAQWGVPVRDWNEADDDLDQKDNGPAAWSVLNWPTKPEIVRTRFPAKDGSWDRDDNRWPFLLHELAHAACPEPPYDLNELLFTTGFEYLSVLYLGLSTKVWERWQGNFGVDDRCGFYYFEEWRDAPLMWRRGKLITACNMSREMGLFVGGKPTFKIARLNLI